jgi:hypothetical protein
MSDELLVCRALNIEAVGEIQNGKVYATTN